MRTRRRAIVALSAMFLLVGMSGCGKKSDTGKSDDAKATAEAEHRRSEAGEQKANATASGATSVLKESEPVGQGCWATVPTFPQAKRNRGRESSVDEQIQALGGKSSWFDGYSETRIYMTHQEPEDVVAFYRQSMPQNGWRERSNTPGKRWGRTKWEMETCNVQLLTGTVGGETMFILGCGGVSAKKIPTAIPALAEGITMHQAFELLRQKSGVGGLAFYGYQAFSVDSQGQSIHFTISGYSPAQKKFCYLNSDVNDIQLHCRDQASIDAPIVSDLATLKGSPEMVREAFAKYAPCPDEKLNLAVNLTQAQAQFLCVAAHWSGEISPYK